MTTISGSVQPAFEGYVELIQVFPFEIPYLKMMQQVLANHDLDAYIENEFAAIYQAPQPRLMVRVGDEGHARELLKAFFGPGFLIRSQDLYNE
jgi:hypothetical protein